MALGLVVAWLLALPGVGCPVSLCDEVGARADEILGQGCCEVRHAPHGGRNDVVIYLAVEPSPRERALLTHIEVDPMPPVWDAHPRIRLVVSPEIVRSAGRSHAAEVQTWLNEIYPQAQARLVLDMEPHGRPDGSRSIRWDCLVLVAPGTTEADGDGVQSVVRSVLALDPAVDQVTVLTTPTQVSSIGEEAGCALAGDRLRAPDSALRDGGAFTMRGVLGLGVRVSDPPGHEVEILVATALLVFVLALAARRRGGFWMTLLLLAMQQTVAHACDPPPEWLLKSEADQILEGSGRCVVDTVGEGQFVIQLAVPPSSDERARLLRLRQQVADNWSSVTVNVNPNRIMEYTRSRQEAAMKAGELPPGVSAGLALVPVRRPDGSFTTRQECLLLVTSRTTSTEVGAARGWLTARFDLQADHGDQIVVRRVSALTAAHPRHAWRQPQKSLPWRPLLATAALVLTLTLLHRRGRRS